MTTDILVTNLGTSCISLTRVVKSNLTSAFPTKVTYQANRTWRQVQITKFAIMKLSPLLPSLLLGPIIFLNIRISDTLTLRSSPNGESLLVTYTTQRAKL